MNFVYLDVIRIKIYDRDYVIKKAVCVIFYIDFSYPTYLYTNMIIAIDLLIHVSCST